MRDCFSVFPIPRKDKAILERTPHRYIILKTVYKILVLRDFVASVMITPRNFLEVQPTMQRYWLLFEGLKMGERNVNLVARLKKQGRLTHSVMKIP